MKKKSLNPLGGRTGRVYKIQNTEKPKLSNANDYYYGLYIEEDDDQETFIMLTEKELERAKYRAARNHEDFVKKGWLTDLMD